MALTYNQITAITQKKFIPKMYDNIFDSNPLLQRWQKGEVYEKIDGGTSIMIPLNYAVTSASGWYSGADTLSTTDNDQFSSAEYDWKQLYANISITGMDEAKNKGDSQIINFVKQKVKIAENTMSNSLGDGIYSAGTDAKSIAGLQVIVSASNTVGGISQSTYSWWAAQLDSSTTTLSISAMASRMSACRIGNDKPSVITTTSTLWDAYHNLLQPQQRFQDSDSAKGGFNSLLFQSCPVLDDSHVPSGDMYFLNEKYLHLIVHKDADMKMDPFQKPVNQDVKTAKIYWYGALGSSNNRMHGAMTALTA